MMTESSCAVPGADPRRLAAAGAWTPQHLKPLPLGRARRCPVAHDPERPAAVHYRLPAAPTLENAGVFEDMVHWLREILRIASGREVNPTAVVIDCRTLHSAPESVHRGAYVGAKRKNGSKVHFAVDKLGRLLALQITLADMQERSQVWRTAQAVQKATGQSVILAYIDQGYAGEQAEDDAENHGTCPTR